MSGEYFTPLSDSKAPVSDSKVVMPDLTSSTVVVTSTTSTSFSDMNISDEKYKTLDKIYITPVDYSPEDVMSTSIYKHAYHVRVVPIMNGYVSAVQISGPASNDAKQLAMQTCVCSVSDDGDAYRLNIVDWVKWDLIKKLVKIASNKDSTELRAFANFGNLGFLHHSYLKLNVTAPVFLKKMQSWLSDQYGADSSWKRVIVFNDDFLGYKVYY